MNDGVLTSGYAPAPMPQGLLGAPGAVPAIDAVRGFDPRSIGTMLAWYDFSDDAFTTKIGGFFSEIRTKSGTGPALAQSVEANRPSVSSLNGRQAALFDGSNDVLAFSGQFRGLGTLLAAIGPFAGRSQNACAFISTSPFIEAFAIGTNDSADLFGSAGRWSGTGGVNTSVTVAHTADHRSRVVAATFTRTAVPSPRVNGRTSVAGSGSVANSNQPFQTIGARWLNASAAGYFGSTIGEILYYPVVLPTLDIVRLETYLKNKWGMAF